MNNERPDLHGALRGFWNGFGIGQPVDLAIAPTPLTSDEVIAWLDLASYLRIEEQPVFSRGWHAIESSVISSGRENQPKLFFE